MSATSGFACSQCGAALRTDGVCSRCVLDAALKSSSAEERNDTSWWTVLPNNQASERPYELLDEIARGGMGIVYRARHRSLDRVVALKMILPEKLRAPAAIKRFRAEAQAVAALDHPAILPIYEVGELDDLPFFSMKLAEGGSLADQMAEWRKRPREAAQLIAQVARAVHHAHERGILHRDLKPGNILLGRNAEPYVADFGIAKWLERQADLTIEASTLGTPYYVAPEQADGGKEKLGGGADIYSLGAILYELLAGRPPFMAETALETLRLVVDTGAVSPCTYNPAIPRDLEVICLKCLEKVPEARYRSAAELADDLERWLGNRSILARRAPAVIRGWRRLKRNPALSFACGALLLAIAAMSWLTFGERNNDHPAPILDDGKSIAVLPFANLSSDPQNIFFAQGIQDEIVTRLSKSADLKVIAESSSQRFTGPSPDLRLVSRQLGVANLLQGSVQRQGEQVRVSVQLISAANNSSRWSESYDRKLTDQFQTESEIAADIALTVQAKLTGSSVPSAPARRTENRTAWQLYLKGRYFWNKTTGEDIRKAINCFNEAIAADSNYAQAYAGLADAYSLLPFMTGASPRDCGPKAKEAATKALELDSSLADAHIALGEAIRSSEFDFNTAAIEFRRGLELDPNDAIGHWHYGWVLMAIGKPNEALTEIKRALDLDPLSLIINADLGTFYILTGRYDDAIEQLRRTLEMDPNFYYAHGNLGEAYALIGSFDAALAEVRKAQQLSDDPYCLVLLSYAFARSGNKIEARQAMDELSEIAKRQYVQAYGLAVCHLALGEKEQALSFLVKAYEDHDAAALGVLHLDPLLAPLRGDPAFERLAQKVLPADR